jgi:GT2 family glycosyltransferase
MNSDMTPTPQASFAATQNRPKQDDLTLLVPTLGRPLLHDCLRSVLAGTIWPGQITVVDQGQESDIASWLDEISALGIGTRYIPSTDTGRARGLNLGLRSVDTEFVCITDDDCLVADSWIEAIAETLHKQPGRVVTGQVLATGSEPMLNTAEGSRPSLATRPGLLFDRLSGGNFAAPMTAFWRAGLFDDDLRLSYCEDGEWAYRALRRGVEIAFVPNATVSHRGWRSEQQRKAQYRGYAASQAAFSGKYLRRGDLFIACRALLNLAKAAKRWLIGSIDGNRDAAANGKAYVSQFLPGLLRGFASKAPPPTLADAGSTVADNQSGPTQGENSIAVVVLTLNQRQQTLRCLEHLLAQRCENLDFTVLVWDNGSTDGTSEAIRQAYPQVRLFGSSENLGVAGGRNAAAATAMSQLAPKLLLFLDNDMLVAPGFVAGLAKPFFADPAGAIGQTQAKLRLADAPELLNDGGGCRLQLWLGRTRPVGFGQTDSGQFDRPTPCVSCGGAMMVRADLFARLQGFDEAFNPFGPEDLDFSLRLQHAGFEAWYMPQAMAFHDVNHTFGSGGFSENYAQYRARHWRRLMCRHAGPLDWLGFVLIGAPIITLRVLIREGRKRNLVALRGLFRGTFGKR